MKYYLEEMRDRNQEIEAYDAWKKYNIHHVMHHAVGSPAGEEVSFYSKALNPYTLGPKVLGGYLVTSDLNSLGGLRRDYFVTDRIWNYSSLEIAVLGEYAEVKLEALLKYANADLTRFFDSCLDVNNWPDFLIIRRISLSENKDKNLTLIREVFNSENISRTHKIELLQKTL